MMSQEVLSSKARRRNVDWPVKDVSRQAQNIAGRKRTRTLKEAAAKDQV